jgi:hypothetical protein
MALVLLTSINEYPAGAADIIPVLDQNILLLKGCKGLHSLIVKNQLLFVVSKLEDVQKFELSQSADTACHVPISKS